ncbi:MAG: ROK family protein [Ignavibacteriales bacterium]|nr:ROK family protein [Ignavibacteriales bacterium]MCB9260423.1 ROK family protein [Ignavibacteriales bacterium]
MKLKYAIGVDLGGTKIKLGIVTSEGRIVKKDSIPTLANEGVDKSISQIKKGISNLLKGNKNLISGIGIGSPGVVSLKKGTVENPPNLPGWGKVHLGRIISKEFSLPTFVENDANAAAIGELIYGKGKKLNSFIMITLGTGVGGGIIYDKKLFRGDLGGAGEIGHLTIDINGPKCNCGSRGCIEAYVGNNYFIANVKKKLESVKESKIFELIDNNLENLSPKTIHDASLLNDEFSIKMIEEMGQNLGFGLASIVNVLDITNVIIGGGVSGFGKILFDSTKNSIKSRVLTPLKSRVNVYPANLKNNAGVKGASSLVFYS